MSSDSGEVVVYGFQNCEICEKAKDKLKRLGVPFTEASYEQATTLHDGWQQDGSVEVMAARSMYGEDAVPLIQVGGEVRDYPSAMAYLKAEKRKPAHAEIFSA